MGDRAARWILSWALVALCGAPGCACELGPRVRLAVDLQTDLQPLFDFRFVRVRVRGEETLREVTGTERYLDASRVAELRVSPGETSVYVELLDPSMRLVASGVKVVDLRTDTLARVFVDARCVGVVCPEGQTCRAGGCRDADCDGRACRLDDREICLDGVCTGDEPCDLPADCPPSADGCSRSECRDRLCVGVTITGACDALSYCRPGDGCRMIPADVDAGPRSDGGPGDGDAAIDGDGGPARDGGIDICDVCTTSCGSTGFGVCEGGIPTGECLPPPERCDNTDDDDCDGATDEGCDHTHGVVFTFSGLDDMGRPQSALIGTLAVSDPPGTVCGGGICGSSFSGFRTLPGPDSHTHTARVNGGATLTFSGMTTPITPGGTSETAGHSHAVRCAIFDGSSGSPSGSTFYHNLEEALIDDPLRYNRFCEDLTDTGVCYSSWGDCVAR